jgi:integrase
MGENAARTLRYLNRRSDPRQRSNLGASTGRPRYKSKVAAFTPGEIAALLDAADAEAATLIRLAVTTGLRIGEPAGLQWRDVDLGKGTIEVRRQFSHGAWAELKTENAKRTIPLPAAMRDELRARYAALNGNVMRLAPDKRTVFAAPEGGPVHYQGFHTRVWVPLTRRAGVKGTPHMLRHSYATALIQSGREREEGADTHGPP